MIVVKFATCYVCGEDVMDELGAKLSACATHSKADKLAALSRIEMTARAERQIVLREGEGNGNEGS